MMRTWIKALVAGLVILVLGFGTYVIAARSGWLTLDEETLRARYALPESQYTTIDGELTHFTDEGEGPAVVLIHGSYDNLRNWQAWVDLLKDRYRVIRFDRPHQGLSGPAAPGRTGADHELRVVEALTASLGVERFFLVATSSAGVSGAAYAADRPDQVMGLILSNIGIGDFTGESEFGPIMRAKIAMQPLFNRYRSTEFWRQVHLAHFHNDDRVTVEGAREWSELNNRALRMRPRIYVPNRDRTTTDLQRMQVPTLLLWSEHDHERPVEIVGQLGLDLLASEDKRLEVVPDCGHMMPNECAAESAPYAAAFFDRIVAAEAGATR